MRTHFVPWSCWRWWPACWGCFSTTSTSGGWPQRSCARSPTGWPCRSRRCSSTSRSAHCRWQYLLEPLGATSFGNAFRATAVGFAASSVLPARAGEVIRPYFLARHERMSATGAFATIILERLLDLVTVLVLLAAFVFVFGRDVATGQPDAVRGGEVGGRDWPPSSRSPPSSCCSCSRAIPTAWRARCGVSSGRRAIGARRHDFAGGRRSSPVAWGPSDVRAVCSSRWRGRFRSGCRSTSASGRSPSRSASTCRSRARS